MASLNGDIVVMRNGRSTSQVSIYNYPEHLNPFYEEDQHKRLRFWKISKKDNEGRRNSFSIGNLKDMWAFKSFRMTKKKSSTLGINKTSESPPPLRREYIVDNGWNSFDHRLRGSTTPSMNGDSFQRNAGCRSSLQNLPSTNDRIGFNRNDDYRSTIQVPRANSRFQQQQKPQVQPRRYVYGGSVTPQPLRNTNLGGGPYQSDHNNETSMTRWGSSQSSMVSTNPFESDVEDENEDVNAMRSANGGSTSTLSKAAQRKKRRAPAPPTPVRGRSDRAVTPTIVIESSQNDTPNDLCIREDTDIANLTAEIESFVKDKDNDDVEPLVITENKTPQKDTKVARELEENTKITTTTTTVITTNTTVPAAVAENEIQKNQKEIKRVEIHSTTSPPRQESVAQTSVVAKTAIPPSEKVESTVESKTITKTEVKTTTSSNETPVPNVVVNEDKPKEEPRVNHQVVEEKIQVGTPQKTERVTVKRSTTTVSESPKLVNGQAIAASEDHKEIMSNGAIPKKVNHPKAQTTSDRVENSDMCIEENHGQSQRPLPAQRSTKADTEVGHVECIHVHVESPRATPRENHENKVSSFKADNTSENVEVITTKTPFVLTSPPRQRKSTQSSESTNEPVKITQDKNSTVALELSIQEEPAKVKPEMVEKPTLSPKPILERNDKVHTFAEIHKPMRNKVTHTVANGQVRRTSRDEVVAPPTIPRHHAEEQPQVVQKAKVEVDGESKRKIETQEVVVPREPQTATTSLNIREPSAAVEEHLNDVASGVSQSPTSMGSSTRLSNESLQFESLYRPQSHMEWKRSTLAPLETNIPPEKRKSVKDIIESINRSQRLLHAAANKDFPLVTGPPSTCASPDGEYSDENLRIMDESQREIRRMVQRINHLDGTSSGATTSNGVMMSKASSPPPSYNECIAAQKLENNEIFQKCKVNKEVYEHQRESSPISSNLDWNPVPKPKRTNPRAD